MLAQSIERGLLVLSMSPELTPPLEDKRIVSMGKIDDPLDATESQYPAPVENPIGEAALDIAGVIYAPAELFNIIRRRFNTEDRWERVEAFIHTFDSELRSVREHSEKTQEEVRMLRDQIRSSEFADAATLAVEEVQFTSEEVRITRLATVLANGVTHKLGAVPGEDLSSFIRDVGQLNNGDIQALQVMGDTYDEPIRRRPDLGDPDEFTMLIGGLLRRVDELKINRDDFYSRCSRLTGFGLALELPRGPYRMSPADRCFRPTLRGLRLLRLLTRQERPGEGK